MAVSTALNAYNPLSVLVVFAPSSEAVNTASSEPPMANIAAQRDATARPTTNSPPAATLLNKYTSETPCNTVANMWPLNSPPRRSTN